MTHELNWVQETKALAENVEKMWRVRQIDNERISGLERTVRSLRVLAFLAAGFALGAVLLAFGWWALNG